MNDTALQRILAAVRSRSDSRAATLAHPPVPENLGIALAAQLRPYRPATIVLWTDVATAVLGHVVARELEATVVYADLDEGRLTLATRLLPGERVALVGYDWPPRPGLDPLVRLVRNHDAEVVAAASVLSADHDSVPVTVLEREERQ